jgi:hypothetical protein
MEVKLLEELSSKYCLIWRSKNYFAWHEAPSPCFEPGCTEYFAAQALNTSPFYIEYVEYENLGGIWRVIKAIDLDEYLKQSDRK